MLVVTYAIITTTDQRQSKLTLIREKKKGVNWTSTDQNNFFLCKNIRDELSSSFIVALTLPNRFISLPLRLARHKCSSYSLDLRKMLVHLTHEAKRLLSGFYLIFVVLQC